MLFLARQCEQPGSPRNPRFRGEPSHARQGWFLCKEDPSVFQEVLDFAVSGRQSRVWEDLLRGRYPEHIRYLEEVENFFDLPEDERAFWEGCIEDHPFVVVLARQRYEELLRKRQQGPHKIKDFVGQ